MTIAKWEYWTVANMLISTHGDAAEDKAHLRIAKAREENQVSDVIVWTEILAKIGEIRSQRDRRSEEP